MQAKHVGAGEIAASMAVWSTWGLVIRWLAVPAWAVALYTGLFASLFAGALWLLTGGRARDLWPGSQTGWIVLMALLSAANNVFFFTAYERTSVANAILTHYTAPVFVAVLAPLTLGERLRSAPAAVLLAGAGMFLLLPGIELSLGSRDFQGVLLGTASGAAYAGVVLTARHLTGSVPPLVLLLYQNLITALVLAPAALAIPLPASLGVWGTLGFVGCVHAAGAGLLYLRGIRKVKAQVAAVLGYLEPLAAVAWAALLLGERVGLLGLLGGLLILGSGMLVVFAKEERTVPT